MEQDMFTNTRPLWRPPGARGVYGGAVIAQCLSAAQRTVPPDFTVHSMHCYFVLAGNSEIPIIYNVERVREGRSFATRTVQARQRGKPIFTVTLSFMKELQGTERVVSHAVAMPEAPDPPPADDSEANRNSNGPFESQHLDSVDGEYQSCAIVASITHMDPSQGARLDLNASARECGSKHEERSQMKAVTKRISRH